MVRKLSNKQSAETASNGKKEVNRDLIIWVTRLGIEVLRLMYVFARLLSL